MNTIILRIALAAAFGGLNVGMVGADMVYAISGEFGDDYQGLPSSGLAFGSFSGTLSASLPALSSEYIGTFDITIYSASGAIAAIISSADSASVAYIDLDLFGSGRDVIDLSNGVIGLQLDFKAPLTGSGPIMPTDTFMYSSYGNGSAASSFVTIAAGSISAVPEPSTLCHCGLGLTIIALAALRRRAMHGNVFMSPFSFHLTAI